MKDADFKNDISISQNITTIKLGFVNAYLIKENGKFILVDTGLSGKWSQLEKKLIAAGCLPDKLQLVIVTHGDSDHTGNCQILQEKYKVKIAMHAADEVIVENPLSGQRKIKSPVMRVMFAVIKFLRLYKLAGSTKKFKTDIFLQDGQNLSEYGFTFSIIHVPGHTKGSIAILTDAGDLFIGDTMVNVKKPESANIIEDEEELKHSLAKLKKYNIKTVYPGHGRPFLIKDLIF